MKRKSIFALGLCCAMLCGVSLAGCDKRTKHAAEYLFEGPEFDISLSFPETVVAGESFLFDVTFTNRSLKPVYATAEFVYVPSTAQFVTVQDGIEYIFEAMVKDFEIRRQDVPYPLEPGDSYTVTYEVDGSKPLRYASVEFLENLVSYPFRPDIAYPDPEDEPGKPEPLPVRPQIFDYRYALTRSGEIGLICYFHEEWEGTVDRAPAGYYSVWFNAYSPVFGEEIVFVNCLQIQ